MTDLALPLILNDFNMGISSLRYLREIAISMVKLDASIIRDFKSNTTHQAMVKNLTSLAHNGNIKVAAKFVEDPDRTPMLCDLRID
ncbi:MAG: EAL domain-containing protein [Acidiferrobacteraceae bacterium]